jgi:hypothetical protein
VIFSSLAIFERVISLAIGAIDYRTISNKKMEPATGIHTRARPLELNSGKGIENLARKLIPVRLVQSQIGVANTSKI